VATSARRPTAENHLGKAGLLDRFAAIATRDDVERTKPHPDVYIEAARRLGVAPERCIAFEDSNVGLEAAHAAGAMAFMVPDLLQPLPETRARCVDVLPDLHAALRLLRQHL
jgi:beta-phosphoglucomutase-like phosphatase (HAD superfamily)